VSIDSDGLLQLARELAGTGRGRPPDANLRRGVSTAYYALFHDITALAVDHALRSAPEDAKSHVRRAWSHSDIASAAHSVKERAQVLRHNPAASLSEPDVKWGPLVGLAARDADMAEAARLFLELQEQRHAADYDHGASIDKASLLSACQDVEVARAGLCRAAAPAREAFWTLLVVQRPHLRGR
jgi:hypothetical protein